VHALCKQQAIEQLPSMPFDMLKNGGSRLRAKFAKIGLLNISATFEVQINFIGLQALV
jgi:hypothetical protein